jgi:hypothetical protein
MSGGIYLMRDDGDLVEMNERGYDTRLYFKSIWLVTTISLPEIR